MAFCISIEQTEKAKIELLLLDLKKKIVIAPSLKFIWVETIAHYTFFIEPFKMGEW